MREVVIVNGVRTAIGGYLGALKNVSSLDLGKVVILEAIRRSGIRKEDVDQVIIATALPANLGPHPAREVTLLAGLPVDVDALTINKLCGSGLKTVMLATQAILLSDADVVIAGGMENMSRVPFYIPQARTGYRLGHGEFVDGLLADGFSDKVLGSLFGYHAENVATQFNVSRQEQDQFALRSYQKAQKAQIEGKFKEEIIPVEIPQRKGSSLIFDIDEIPQKTKTSIEILSGLSPAFKEGGTITAGNCSKQGDAASALVLMSKEKADKLGLKYMARIVAYGEAGITSQLPPMAPMKCIPKVLKKAGLQEKEIEIHEINEAFAVSNLAIMKELNIDEDKCNLRGSAISLGHPIAATGARLLVTLMSILKEKKAKLGMASLCIGGGEAVSMIIERP